MQIGETNGDLDNVSLCSIMKQEEDHGDDQTSYLAPVMIKINSSLQHLRIDLMQHQFVTTYLRQITDVCDPPAN
jgi:hypothetical protein